MRFLPGSIGMRRLSRIRVAVTLGVLPILLLVIGIVSYRKSVISSAETALPVGASGLPTAPIPGSLTTLPIAKQQAGYGVPILKSAPLSDRCGRDRVFGLVNIWVGGGETDEGVEPVQLGMNHTHGVWVSVSPSALMEFGAVSEMPTVESWFPPEDYPSELFTTSVRGHTAWANEFDSEVFSCDTGEEVSVENDLTEGLTEPNLSASPDPALGCVSDECPPEDETQVPAVPAPAFMYDPITSGSIKWMEDDLVIHVVGPFTVSELAELVEGEQLTFL